MKVGERKVSVYIMGLFFLLAPAFFMDSIVYDTYAMSVVYITLGIFAGNSGEHLAKAFSARKQGNEIPKEAMEK